MEILCQRILDDLHIVQIVEKLPSPHTHAHIDTYIGSESNYYCIRKALYNKIRRFHSEVPLSVTRKKKHLIQKSQSKNIINLIITFLYHCKYLMLLFFAEFVTMMTQK